MDKNGGPAFPRPASGDNPYSDHVASGMTLRQWYKGQALAGRLARHASSDGSLARMCASVADAMLAEDAAHENLAKETK